MIVAGMAGGLASQLHKYAIARSLADTLGLDLKLDCRCYNKKSEVSDEKRSFELDRFNIRAVAASDFEIIKSRGYIEALAMKIINSGVGIKNSGSMRFLGEVLREKFGSNCYRVDITKGSTSYLYESIANSGKKNFYITGEWGFEANYLSMHRSYLVEDFKPVEKLSERASSYLNIIKSRNAIACHIRRGDYINGKFHALCTEDYYMDGINYLQIRRPNSNIVMFTDDLGWAKKFASTHLPKEVVFVEGCQAWEDFHLMSKCNDYVISASGFSSLAAWLCDFGDKMVVAPKKWVNDEGLNSVFIGQLPTDWHFM